MGFQSGSYQDERVRQAESDKRTKYEIIKLPCCNTGVQVKQKRDIYIKCPNPECGKTVAITWQRNATFNSQIGGQHEPSLSCTCNNCLRHFNGR